MTSHETHPKTADHADSHRRSRVIVRPKRAENLTAVIEGLKSYPSPVRARGADYSQTRCVGADGGTTLDTSELNKILEIGSDHVRAQAGVRVGYLVRALAERGMELPLTPEIGNISVGTMATASLPQASMGEGMANMSSCVTEMTLITAQGKPLKVTHDQPALMQVMRSSFGLLGVVHEARLKIRPMIPVKVDYQSFGLKEFSQRFPEIMAQDAALRLHIFPFSDKITVERRTRDEEASTSRSGIWQIRHSVLHNVLPAFGASVGGILAAPGLRYFVLSGVQRAAHATLDRAARGVVMYAHEWLRDLPREAWRARYTHSLWAFPQTNFPQLLREYFRFCDAHYKQHRYRCNLVHNSSRLHRDRNSLFTVSDEGAALTLEPSSTGDAGWDEFLIDFNEFASANGGKPTFNQTRALRPEHALRAFGKRLTSFRSLRARTDPRNRLLNVYFAHLLG